jgi:hypothetical protein
MAEGRDALPVDRETHDRTIETLNAALNNRDVDRRERGGALRRLTRAA